MAVLEEMYPAGSAHDWDSVGLVCGDPSAPVDTVHFAVDPTLEVAGEALRGNADLLVTHHPLLLRAVHSIAADGAKGKLLHRLIRGNVALFNAHTNADDARPGVSDALARTLGLTDLRPLRPAPAQPLVHLSVTVPAAAVDQVLDAATGAGAGTVGEYRRCAFTVAGHGTFEPSAAAEPTVGEPGVREVAEEVRLEFTAPTVSARSVIAAVRSAHPYEEPVVWAGELLGYQEPARSGGTGRVGRLAEPMSLERFALLVAEALPYSPQGVRVSGPAEEQVQTVAVCGGAGDSLFEDVRASEADVYLTADLRHHPASEAREQARGGKPFLVDVAHWSSEWPWLHGCASRLQTTLLERQLKVQVRVSEIRTDPWTFRVPSSGGIVR